MTAAELALSHAMMGLVGLYVGWRIGRKARRIELSLREDRPEEPAATADALRFRP